MALQIKKLSTPTEIDANWNKDPWLNIPAEQLNLYMGKKPKHFPKTEVKVAYDEDAIYIIFRVEDQYVRCVETSLQGNVCRDSCVEFFFVPGPDKTRGYFNLEINSGGTLLFHFQQARSVGTITIPENETRQIEIEHSLPKTIDPEIEEPITWTMEARIPFSILEPYAPVTRPEPGVTWFANFYKCGDQTSHPHWLTWAPVDLPSPDFHQPSFFDALKFYEPR